MHGRLPTRCGRSSTTLRELHVPVDVPYSQGSWRGELVSDVVRLPETNAPTVRCDVALIQRSTNFYINGSEWQVGCPRNRWPAQWPLIEPWVQCQQMVGALFNPCPPIYSILRTENIRGEMGRPGVWFLWDLQHRSCLSIYLFFNMPNSSLALKFIEMYY